MMYGVIPAGISGKRSHPGRCIELPGPNSDPWSSANAVNDSGHMVGYSGNYNTSVGKAWLWDGTTVSFWMLYGTLY